VLVRSFAVCIAAGEDAIGFELVRPSLELVPAYVDALQRGWSSDTERDDARFEELADIGRSAEDFIARMDDPDALGGPIALPDGTFAARLPGFRRWLWDGEFAGSIGFRWTPGSAALPPTCLGHIGYSVVEWKRGRGYAKAALALMLPEARERGLPYVEIVANVDNVASQRVALANGAVLVERFNKGPQYHDREGLRFRIPL
jgi:predicted acetyltransferase